MSEIILILHATFGVLGILSGVWVFVETLNCSEINIKRLRLASLFILSFMWLAYFFGGYWYVVYYQMDKPLILKGPWPFAHSFFMEVKEHLFFLLLLLSTYLPIVTFENDLTAVRNARILVLITSALIVLLGLVMEGSGAIISMGVRMALLGE